MAEADGGPGGVDTRAWIGTLRQGSEAEHEAFVAWLNGPEAHEVFRRRRLTEYRLVQDGLRLTVVFSAPHTGDPRIMIDFLRYPGVWPDFWQFERAGGAADAAGADATSSGGAAVRVHWRREA